MKKILCLVMATVMMFTCIGAGVTASALDPIDRPNEVANVINPIINGHSTDFAVNINEIGYSSINSYAEAGKTITKGTFNTFIAENADDKMFGVDFDFLYSKDTSSFLWNSLEYKLEAEPSSDLINKMLEGVKDKEGNTVNYDSFIKAWNNTGAGRAYTIHDVEMYKANVEGSLVVACSKKGAYDACGEAIFGYAPYEGKDFDKSIYDCIVETKTSIVNPFTYKYETHYNYSFRFAKGDFGLTRANTNNLIADFIGTAWGDGALFATPELASKNAVALANFIGKFINPQFKALSSDLKPFTDNKKISRETFFEQVTILSGLDSVLQSKWCYAKGFDVKAVMSAFGVNTDDSVIFDVELTKGSKMGARILADIYSGFTKDPMGYIMHLVQLFCKNYEYTYEKAFSELFSVRYNSMLDKSRNGNYEYLTSYKGTELKTVDGFFNFISDCLYVDRVDAGDTSAMNFEFAPLPLKRFASAADINELYLYMLCYFELNRIYENNGAIINAAIEKVVKDLCESYDVDYNSVIELSEDEENKDVFNIYFLNNVLRDMFCGDMMFARLFAVQLGALMPNIVEEAPEVIESTAKKGLAGLLQRFLNAMDNLLNLLFGWTNKLFK